MLSQCTPHKVDAVVVEKSSRIDVLANTQGLFVMSTSPLFAGRTVSNPRPPPSPAAFTPHPPPPLPPRPSSPLHPPRSTPRVAAAARSFAPWRMTTELSLSFVQETFLRIQVTDQVHPNRVRFWKLKYGVVAERLRGLAERLNPVRS